jgi:hypothetical protein
VRRAALPLALLLVLVFLSAVQVPLVVAMGDSLTNLWGELAMALPFAVVGGVVAWRQPRNPVGWLLIATIVCFMVSSAANGYELLVYRRGDHLPAGIVSLVLEPTWLALVLLPPLAIALFPDGRVSSRVWRWALRAYIAIASLTVLAVLGTVLDTAVTGTAHVTADGDLTVVANPGSGLNTIVHVGVVAAGLCALLAIGGQVVRWRRSDGTLRQQLKWLMSGAAVCLVTLALLLSGPIKNSGGAWNALGPIGIGALPLAIGVGILRYRLYDIDVIIRRTLTYAALVAVLAAAYVGGIVVIGHVLESVSGQSGAAAVTFSTLAVAAAFQPLRRRIQELVDRRFYRAAYDSAETVRVFTERLRDEIDLRSLEADLLDTVAASLHPSHATLWLRSDD